jgi:hypothetical protein
VPYALEGPLRRELAAAGIEIESAEHGSLALLRWQVGEDQAAALRLRLTDATQGRIDWR